MRKIYLFLMVFVFCLVAKAQTLNVSAGWPNSNWAVTGSYATGATAFESDPRTTANFAFDDDDAGSGHKDIIAAESPVIDLTAAHTAGENFIEVTAMYGFRRNATVEILRLEYWNVATSAWVAWSNINPNNTSVTDNFCTITKTLFTSDALGIASFTPAQLSGFKYRIYYNDSSTGTGWQYGFCFDSPTIKSSATAPVANCDATLTAPLDGSDNVGLDGVLTWTAATGAVTGYKIAISTTPNSASPTIYDAGNVLTFNIPGLLASGTTYYFKIIPYNLAADATGCTEYSFTTLVPPTGATCEDPHVIDSLPYNTTDNTSEYLDLYEGAPGATGCGTTGVYLNGNDVVYSYTATTTGSINILMTPTATWSGIFVYGSCADIGVSCLAGVANSGTTVRTINEFPVTAGQTYFIVISTNAAPQATGYTLDITENTCTNAVATYTVVSNCANGNEEFFVDVNVTSMGSASGLSIYDDQGIQTESVSAIGVYQFGPYANATNVIITIENEQDSSCVITSPVRTQLLCPPVNDNCSEAIALTVNDDYACADVTAGSTSGATASSAPGTVTGTPNNDVWYSFVATSTGHRISLTNIVATSGTSNDMGIAIYNGAAGCDALVLVGSSDPETYNVTGLTPDVTYYVRVYGWGASATNFNTFDICIGSPPAPPVNDLIGNATVLTESPVGTCTNAVAGTTVSATHSAEYVCNATDIDVWYIFTPSTTGIYNFSRTIVSGSGNGYISVYSGASSSLTRLNTSCSSTSFSQALTAGTQYYVSVSAAATTSSTLNFSLCVSPAAPAPANDLIENAAVLTESPVGTCTNAVAGTTISATHSAEYACSATDIDVWYTFTPSATGIYNFSRTIVSGTGNGYVSVYSGASSSLTRLNTSCSSTSFSQALTAGTQYYVSVSAAGTTTSTLNFSLCVSLAPPAPANDNCATPTVLIPAGTYAAGAVVSSNVSGTIESGMVSPTCGVLNSTNGRDVWFSVVAPASGTLRIETGADAGSSLVDTVMQAYRGTCGTLVAPTGWCNDDIASGTNIFSRLSLTGLTAGETILVRVWNYGTTASGTFQISAYDASLSTVSFDNTSFKVYPNPVKDVLKLSYSQDMTSVSVFNLLGQEVINKSLNASEAQVDMSNLSAGTYLVKVAVDNQVKTVKVVKQ